MKQYRPVTNNFIQTYKQTSVNSLQFENICETEVVQDSLFGIKIWTNEILERYLNEIVSQSKLMDFGSKQNAKKYYMNPQRLSKDALGSSDYWYIILAINGFTTKFDFKNFTAVMIPNINHISNILNHIENERKK